jgi:hypothetical protein
MLGSCLADDILETKEKRKITKLVQMTKKDFKELRKLLYSNQETLQEKIPPSSLMKLLHDYNNPKTPPPEQIVRRDLRYIKSVVE